MDQQLEESLNLDSSMGVEFDHNDEVIVGQSDIVLEDSDETSATLTPITCMDLEHLKDHQIMMKSEQDIIGDNYTLQHLAVPDMPVIGGEEEVFAEAAEDDLVKEIIVKSELSAGDFEITIGNDVTSDCGLPEITEEQEIVSSDSVVPIPLQTQINLALQNTRSTKTNLRQVAIAPKPHTVKYGQSKFTSLSANKQWTIAPKPVTMLPAKTSVVKKIAIGNVSRSSNVNLGSFGPGKQLVLLPSSSSSGGQAQRLKLVQNTGSSSVQYIKADGQILQPQVVTAKRISPSVGQKQVMTKVIVQGGNTDNQAPGGQPVLAKLLSTSTGLTGSPRYISLQQAQQMGLISGHTAAKMVAVSPTKAGNQTVRLGRPKQPVLTVKPPAKILPAPPQGVPKKIVIQQTPQSVVLSPASGKPTQVVREAVPQVTGVFTNIAPAQPISARQMKGVQYVRVVPASSVSSCGAITPKSPVKAVNTTPTPIAPRPTTTGASSGRTLLTLPGGKTLLLADGQGTLLQMVSDKVSPPPLAVLSNNSSALSKLSSKPQQKLVRIAPVVQKMSQASSGASSYSLNRSVLSMSTDTTEVGQSMDQEMPPPEDSKPSLQSLIAEMVSEDNEIVDEVDNSNIVESEDPEDESMEADEDDERVKIQDSHDQSEVAENQRIVMYPASYDTAKSIGNVVEIKQEVLNQYQMPKATSGQSVDNNSVELGLRPRKPCNCTKSQCLKLYCDCFANGEFCNQCNCNNCFNNLENEEERQKAIRSCLERNPNAFRPKIGKAKSAIGPEAVRRHNKGCNCKRSGCLKNYCECYEAKIACSANCKCVGCRNVEETVERGRRRDDDVLPVSTSLLNSRDHHTPFRQSAISHSKEPYSFMTGDVIDAVCQCLLAAAVEGGGTTTQAVGTPVTPADPVQLVLEEFARCLQDIIGAARQAQRPPAEPVL